jgi:hypothetical protein
MDMVMLDANCFGTDWPALLGELARAMLPPALLVGALWCGWQLRRR